MSQTKAELIQTVKQGTVSLGDADSSHSIKLKAPATVAADRTWTMPAVDPTANQVLTADASTPTTLTWAAAAAGVTLSGSTDNTICTVTGANAIQGETKLTFDGSVLRLENTAAAGDGVIYLEAGEGGSSVIEMIADEGDDDADKFRILVGDGGPLKIQNKAGGSYETNIECAGDAGVKLFFNNSEKMEANNTGISVTGSVTPSGGIYLGGAGGGNYLDDYETGTWTPADGGGIVPFATATGTYVKVGKIVTCFLYIQVTVNVTSTGSVYLVGLPFTSANQDPRGVSSVMVNVGGDAATTSNFQGWLVSANSTLAYGYKDNFANTTRVQLWDGDPTDVSMWGQITYQTA